MKKISSMDPQQLKYLPELPGVYLMKGAKGQVLYVGKALNLKNRVKQYFGVSGDGRAMIPLLVKQVVEIETIVVSSEKEALLLENNLIKEHNPKYNVLLKDDKAYIALKINIEHEWPMVSIVRYRGKPKDKGLYFGPYTSAYAARQTLDLLHRLFPLRQCSDEEIKRRTRPCILYDMKRCIAPCVNYCSKEEYQTHLDRTIRFLRGKDSEVVSELTLEMEKASESLEFEKAAEILKRVRWIERTIEKQNVENPLGSECDVIGLYREGGEVQLAKVLFRNGRLTCVRHFHFSNCAQENADLLSSFLLQHYGDLEEKPKEVIAEFANEELEELLELKLSLPKRGAKFEKLEMAQLNAKAEFTRRCDKEAIAERTLLELQEKLSLNNFPKRIECIDTSSLSQSDPVAAVIVFNRGVAEKSSYRKFKIKTAKAGDDYGSIYEVLMRRYSKLKEEGGMPDLLVVDGGKGQLNVGLRVLKELGIINVDVISLVKERGRHDKGVTGEGVFIPNVKDPIFLRKSSSSLFLLQRIRDEAHRFAISFQQKRRSEAQVSSVLDTIPGIGPQKRKNLLKFMGSVRQIKQAIVEELEKVPKISKRDAQVIYEYFNNKKK